MKYTVTIPAAVILLGLLSAAPVAAQSPSSPYVAATAAAIAAVPSASDDPQDTVLTIRTRVNEVNVLFIATDKHGKFVRDLSEKDFAILDDHKPPQAILNFRRETDLPLHLGLLIDISGSVNSRFDFEQTAATNF